MASYCPAIIDELLDHVVVGWEETEDDVKEVDHVDNYLDVEPLAFSLLQKGHAIRSHDSGEQTDSSSLSLVLHENEEIPFLLPGIVREDDAFGVVLEVSESLSSGVAFTPFSLEGVHPLRYEAVLMLACYIFLILSKPTWVFSLWNELVMALVEECHIRQEYTSSLLWQVACLLLFNQQFAWRRSILRLAEERRLSFVFDWRWVWALTHKRIWYSADSRIHLVYLWSVQISLHWCTYNCASFMGWGFVRMNGEEGSVWVVIIYSDLVFNLSSNVNSLVLVGSLHPMVEPASFLWKGRDGPLRNTSLATLISLNTSSILPLKLQGGVSANHRVGAGRSLAFGGVSL